MRKLIARLIKGGITRRDFARRLAGYGFGAATAESILDSVASGADIPKRPHQDFPFKPYGERTFFDQWGASEGVPVHTGYHIEDVRAVELKAWNRFGVRGAIIDLQGAEGTDVAFIIELAPGQSTRPMRCMFEESIFVLDGRGETTVWHERGHSQTFKWTKRSLFSPPLNVWRVHKNLGQTPVKLISFNDLPVVMDLFHNLDFIFDNDFVFRDRYNDERDFFVMNPAKFKSVATAATYGEGDREGARLVESGLVPDIKEVNLYESKGRGISNRSVEMCLSNNTMQTHLSQFDVGTYKRAHRHGPGSHVLSLEGVGYTLFWTENPKYSEGRQHIRADWKDGTLFVPPDRWFHQHFNTGQDAAMYMATEWIGAKYLSKALGGGGRTHRLNTVSTHDGGNMVDYPDEDPAVRALFEEELKKHGVPSRMPASK
jgi:oxalate decarboxylase/phosphoglucose isomerase-like protein (cupin superfamily)